MRTGKSSVIKIDKFSDHNYHVCKQKLKLVLTFKELNGYGDGKLETPTDELSRAIWQNAIGKAKAIIGHFLANGHLEYVLYSNTAADIRKVFSDLCQQQTLLKHLAAPRKLYTAQMKTSEKVLSNISQVKQLSAYLESIDVHTPDQKVAMTVPSELPTNFGHLNSATDGATSDEKASLEFVKNRLLQ